MSMIKRENDATTCHNKIILCLALLIIHMNQMPKIVCVVHVWALKQVKYHSKFLFQIPEELHQHSQITVIYSASQKSTNFLYLWLLFSNIITKARNHLIYGAHYSNSHNKYKVSNFVLGLINNINLFVDNFNYPMVLRNILIGQL